MQPGTFSLFLLPEKRLPIKISIITIFLNIWETLYHRNGAWSSPLVTIKSLIRLPRWFLILVRFLIWFFLLNITFITLWWLLHWNLKFDDTCSSELLSCLFFSSKQHSSIFTHYQIRRHSRGPELEKSHDLIIQDGNWRKVQLAPPPLWSLSVELWWPFAKMIK